MLKCSVIRLYAQDKKRTSMARDFVNKLTAKQENGIIFDDL